jgi:hypothetical protein
VLGDELVPVIAVAVAEDHRLGDNAAGAQGSGRLQQLSRASGPQQVGLGHVAVAHGGLLEGGELVDDRVGGQGVDRGQQTVAVQGVGHHRPSPQAGQQRLVG